MVVFLDFEPLVESFLKVFLHLFGLLDPACPQLQLRVVEKVEVQLELDFLEQRQHFNLLL